MQDMQDDLKTFPSQSAKLALATSTKGQDTSAKSADKQTKFYQKSSNTSPNSATFLLNIYQRHLPSFKQNKY